MTSAGPLLDTWRRACVNIEYRVKDGKILLRLRFIQYEDVFYKNHDFREHVEFNALNSWKISIFNIIEKRILFYSKNLNLLPPKPKLSFRHLKHGIQQFHEKFVLAPADKPSNNAIVV